ncbi:unnamed protein product [Phytophthora fragariaefolia]|uniref:Unnamed protein product n=1 Tax=Phytophthora fragariaefolia TaxID=1490495 RepID=A0A9W6TQZ2_9STRA|nr:unnamed protein product [Phytophthora fragariaefolia]
MAVLELKDLGVVSKFLGIGFEYDEDKGWLLEQHQVILGMLDKFGLSAASTVRVPIGGEHENDVDGELLPNDGPDIAYAVHRVTRCTHAPHVSDWRLAKKIARYLKGTLDTKFAMHAVRGGVSEATIVAEGYSDADFAGDRVDHKSVRGGVLMVCGMVVGWICKNRNSVALCMMEAEFGAASQITAEMLDIVELLSEIGLKVKILYKLRVDNQAVIKQIEGAGTSGRAKHTDIRFKFIKDLPRNKGLEVSYCESKLMRADILTKTLPAPRLEELRVLVMLTT